MRGLTLKSVEISLSGQALLAIDAHIEPGEVLSIMGPSGSGKSTLLAAITGTLDPAFSLTGDILLDGAALRGMPTHKRRAGLMMQDHLLFPHMSVGGNIAFGLSQAIRGRRARMQAVEAALEQAGLAGLASRDPATLSGGQKARVALMRTLLADPGTLLLDEPFSRLDTERRGQIRDFVFTLARRKQLPVLLVTHDHEDASAAGGRIIHLH